MTSNVAAVDDDTDEKIQTIVFVRHGIARHNLIDPKTGQLPNLKDPTLLDPPLVRDGRLQASDAGERLHVWWHTTQLGERVELVMTSPLTRCLQTATLAFLPGLYYTNGWNEPSFYCTEIVREAYGKHFPDRRRNKSLLQKHWPKVQFDPAMTEADEQWSATHRESVNELQARCRKFVELLPQRPETNIVCVSHGVFIEVCLNMFTNVLDKGNQRVYNCDMFAGECVSLNGKFIRFQNFRQVK